MNFSDKSLLLVEDETLIAMAKQQKLKKYGYNILIANTGEKAVTIIKSNENIDLILMDIDLGHGLDGTKAAEIILGIRDIPIVFMSSHTEPEIVEKTEKITSYGYVVKNSSITVLDASIKMAFKLFGEKQTVKKHEQELIITNTSLNSEKQKFSNLLRDLPGFVYRCSNNYDYTLEFISEGCIDVTGYKPEELIGKNIYSYIDLVLDDWVDVLLKKRHKQFPVRFYFEEKYPIKSANGKIKWVWERSRPIVDENNNLQYIEGYIEDITESKHLEEIIKESNSNLNSLINNQIESIWSIDRNYNYVIINNFYEEEYKTLFNIKLRKGMNALNQMPMEHVEFWKSQYDKALSGEEIIFEYSNKVDGNIHFYKISFNPIFTDKGIIGVTALSIDITERKKIEQLLQEKEKKYRGLVEMVPGIVYSFSNLNGGLYHSSNTTTILGYTPEQLNSQPDLWYSLIHPEDIYLVDKAIKESKPGKSFLYEYRIQDAQGNWHWFEDRPYRHQHGEEIIIEGLAIDITERKHAEEEINILLNGKEILLKEVHHRIKNNMNIIKSLLMMQNNEINIPEVVPVFQDAISRIESMEILYDKLYRSEIYEEISIKDYLSQLFDEVVQIFPDKLHIEIEKQIEDFSIKTKFIFSLGLILNELITNSMKYAFIGRKDGLLRLVIRKEINQVILVFEDNGIGLSELKENERKGFGIQLIEILVTQIEGNCKIDNSLGTKYTIEFELD